VFRRSQTSIILLLKAVRDYTCTIDCSIWDNNDCGISSWKWKSAIIYLQVKYALAIHLSLQQDLHNFYIRHFRSYVQVFLKHRPWTTAGLRNAVGVVIGLFTYFTTKTKLNSVALVRKRTIPTERPPLSAK
jgi:hypothetical protein